VSLIESLKMSDDADLARKVFINREGELRSGWRVAIFFVLFQIFSLLLGGLLLLVFLLVPSLGRRPGTETPAGEFVAGSMLYLGVMQASLLGAALAASWVCARVLERRSFASTGYKLHRGWLRDFGLGSLAGAATLGLAVLIAALAGAAHFQWRAQSAGAVVAGLAALFVFFLVSAAYEEVLLRGFAFQALAHNMGAAFAIALTSVIFGLLHLSNPNVTAFSTLNTILAGVWLAAAYLKTRSLWLATALHYSWNFAMVFVFGLPVSGITMFDHLALTEGRAADPAWLSGGSYGPEGGLAATIAIALATLVIWKGKLFGASEEMLEAIKHGGRQHSPESETPLGLAGKEPRIDPGGIER
jgi:membrane protease YdiL (CAAX protease family)